jgi:hypothetical protein
MNASNHVLFTDWLSRDKGKQETPKSIKKVIDRMRSESFNLPADKKITKGKE